MTVTLSINGKPASPSDEAEITQQISRRRDDDAAICVRVGIKSTGIDVTLGTAACGGGGGGRRANEREQLVIDLWNQLRLSEDNFAAGQIIAFLRQVRRFE